MSDIIDSALLNEKLAALSREKGYINYDSTFTKEEVLKLIDQQAKADAVKVVRCRDCILYDSETELCSWWNIHIHDKNNYCLPGTEKTLNKTLK